MNSELPEAIVNLSDSLLDQLLEFKSEHPWLTFWLRSQDNKDRLSNGLWFQGTENYIFIGLVKLGSSNNKTKSIGFIVEFDANNDISNMALEAIWGGITDGRFVEFFTKLPQDIKGLENISNKKLSKVYHHKGPQPALDELLNNDLPDLIRIIHEHGLGKELLITEPEFQKQLAKTEEFRSRISTRQTKLVGGIWLGGSTWNKDKTEEFLKNGVWLNGNSGKYQDKINATEKGDYLLLKSINRRQKPAFLILKAIGKVLHNPKDGERLDVLWKRLDPFVEIQSLARYNLTYHKLREEDIPSVFSNLNEGLMRDLKFEYEERVEIIEQQRSSKLLTQTLTFSQPNYDSITGDDALNITNDVNVFAAILALKSLKPPFAVALFGNWGSGKSFFMNKLKNKIGWLSKQEEKDSKDQRLYCQNIAQIDFNAWSYLDANLWAGLISSIFQRLNEYITDTVPGDPERESVLKELEDEFELSLLQRASIQDELTKLNDDLTKLNIQNFKNERDTAILNLTTYRNEGYKELVAEALGAVNTEELQSKLKDVGFDSQELDPSRASDAWKSIKLIGRQFTKLNWRDLLLILVIVWLLFVLPFLTTQLLDAPWLGSAIGYITLFLGIVKKGKGAFEKVLPLLAMWAEKKEELSTKQNEAEQEYKKRLSELEDKRNQAIEELLQKEKKHRLIEEKIELLDFEINHSLNGKALFSFISKRNKSEDYESQLGIISLIRRDLETLSSLFVEMTIDKDMPEPEKKLLEEKKKRLSGIRKKMGDKSLDRIILYIDDLDRCPDDKVLDVLQAVHLLMAFPLFIVVVGVDSRSVTNALYYRNVIKYSQGLGLNNPEELKKYGISTIKPSEYLEKIFQIPFQLKKPTENNVKGMMRGLVGNVVDVDRQQKVDISPPSGNGITSTYSEQPKIDGPEEIENRKQDQEEKENEVPKEALELTSVELQDTQALGWMVGDNPRAIKRFINMFRLIRAHAGVIEVEEEKELERLIMMFVLAFYIGPYRAHVGEFEKMIKTGNGQLNQLLKSDLPQNDHLIANFNEIHTRLSGSLFQKILLDLDLSMFQDHLEFISRFTFPIENSPGMKNL